MATRATIRWLARLGWTAAFVGLAVLVLAASASAKGPPSGKGGPPPWAGGASKGGSPASAARGKGDGAPPPAAKAKGAAKKAEKALEKAARKTAKAREQAEQNPAMRCFALIGELGEEFYETYGTNPNKANAFGKCVSEHAREQGGDGDEEPAEEPAECEEPAESEQPADGEEPAEDPLAELASFDEEPPAEDACESAGDETGEPEDGAGDGDEETEPETGDDAELMCFVPAAARANPFAVCARA